MKKAKIVGEMIDLAVKYPDIAPDRLIILELKKETIEKVITPSRIELIRIIKTKEPESIGELSKMAGRPIESVSRDLKILENYGILEIIQTGKTRKPRIEKDAIMIPITE